MAVKPSLDRNRQGMQLGEGSGRMVGCKCAWGRCGVCVCVCVCVSVFLCHMYFHGFVFKCLTPPPFPPPPPSPVLPLPPPPSLPLLPFPPLPPLSHPSSPSLPSVLLAVEDLEKNVSTNLSTLPDVLHRLRMLLCHRHICQVANEQGLTHSSNIPLATPLPGLPQYSVFIQHPLIDGVYMVWLGIIIVCILTVVMKPPVRLCIHLFHSIKVS